MTLLDNEWRKWITRNRLLGQPPSNMLAAMVGAGIDQAIALQELSDVERDPIFMAAMESKQYHRKLESVVANLQKVWQTSPTYRIIDRRSKNFLTNDEFYHRYVLGCRPCIITDMANDWPAMQRWTPDQLKARFGHHQVEVQDNRESDPRFEENKLSLRRNMLFGEFIDRVMSLGESNDIYLTANNELLRRPEFASLLDDVGELPSYVDPSRMSNLSSFWVGPKGTVTPLHHDTVMLFHAQIMGRKKWKFISPLETPKVYNSNGVFSPVDIDNPDYDKYPLFRDVQILETVVEPGEAIYLPLGWWHSVTSLDLSISLSFINLNQPNYFDYNNPNIRDF